MARIKDIIAAIVTTGDSFEDVVRIITVAGYSAKSLKGEALGAELNWVASQANPSAMKAMAAQGVVYKKLNLKLNTPSRDIAQRAQKFLHELQVRDELNYPFIIAPANSTLFISAIDLEIITAIAREQQMQDDHQPVSVNPETKYKSPLP